MLVLNVVAAIYRPL